MFNSMLAWRRLMQIGEAKAFEEGSRSWPSRLLVHADIITMADGKEFVVLAVGRWGALVAHVSSMEGELRRIYAGESGLDIVFLLETDVTAEWPRCSTARGAPSEDGFALKPAELQQFVAQSCVPPAPQVWVL